MSGQLIRRIDGNTGKAQWHTLEEWNIINGYAPAPSEVMTADEYAAYQRAQQAQPSQPAPQPSQSHHAAVGAHIASHGLDKSRPKPQGGYKPVKNNPNPNYETDPRGYECDG